MKKTKVKCHTIFKCAWCATEVNKCSKCNKYFYYNDIIYCNENVVGAHYCENCMKGLVNNG